MEQEVTPSRWRTHPRYMESATQELMAAWWDLRRILSGMKWTIESGAAITQMDDAIKAMDPSHMPDEEATT